MSQAETLLASLTDGSPEHEHPVSEPNGYFVIDPSTRAIAPVGDKENVVMQFDHASERYVFELPRYVEGHDMALCNRVRVHFNNIEIDDGEPEVVPVDSVTGGTTISHEDVAELTDLTVSMEDNRFRLL